MTLFQSTMIMELAFALLGVFFFLDKSKALAFAFLRSKNAAYVLYGLAGAYFMYILFNLGQSDFGDLKHILIPIFGAAWLLSFKFLDDFLSVRGLFIIFIFACREFIDSAYMLDIPARYTLVGLSYLVVLISIYMACLPYRLRDLFEYLYEKPIRAKCFGVILFAASTSLTVSMLFY